MTYCVFGHCKSSIRRKIDGISFYKFPKDDVQRDEWISIIRQNREDRNWKPRKNALPIEWQMESWKKANPHLRDTMVKDNITNPSKPVGRSIDEMLWICCNMMREKDQQITILKKQVEKLTKKNKRLINAMTHLTMKNTGDNTEQLVIDEENAADTEDCVLIDDDTYEIKTEIEVHEHDVNNAINVSSGSEEETDVYPL